MSTVDFKTTVPAAQAGDKAAQDTLMAALYGWSVSCVKTYVRDEDNARDIAVEFWADLFAGDIRHYDERKGTFLTWATDVLRNRAIDATRKGRPQVVYYSEVSDPTRWDPDPADRMSAVQDLETVAGKLRTPQHKEVFWRLIEGATAEEIAEEIGVSTKRARNLTGEVRAVITEQLGDDDGNH